MKISDLKKLISIFNDDKNDNELKHNGEEVRIIILQRGWVIIGRYYQHGSQCWIESGYVIRNWGTTQGLGELATSGKQESTKLDFIPKTQFHELTIVASIICDKSKWLDLCK